MKRFLPENASLREQIDAHLTHNPDRPFRCTISDADAAKFARHAPLFMQAWRSDSGEATTALGVDIERLYAARASNGGKLSPEGEEVFQVLSELRHLFFATDRMQRDADRIAERSAMHAARPSERWVDAEGRPVHVYAPGEPLATAQALNGPDLGDIVRAVALGRGLRDVRNAMSEGSDSAGGALVPTELAAGIIDKMRSMSVCQKAGQRTVRMPSASFLLAKIGTDPTISWATEAANLSDTAPTLAQVTLTAKTLRGWVLLSRELVEDALNLGEELGNVFGRAMGVELDRVSLFGSGTGAEPRGIGAASGAASGTSMGTNGLALANLDPLVSEWQALADANANVDNLSMVMAPRTAAAIAKLKDTTNQPLQFPPILANVRRFSTTSVPTTQTQGSSNAASTIVTGDFSQLILGVRSELQVIRSDGFLATNQIALGFVLRADIAWTDAASFHRLYGVL